MLYVYDSNAILAEPMKNRSNAETIRAHSKLHRYLVERGLTPQLQKVDNKASTALKLFLRNANIHYQLVPPHMHRQNTSERTIQTFKNHFVAGLSSTDKPFPLHLCN